jgi:predicted  nucleic acid-binding Zn-ribbon protein
MSKENKKQIKAQLINEISSKYTRRIADLEVERGFLIDRIVKTEKQNQELRDENLELKSKIESYEDWIRRLQEFMDMDPETRDRALKTLESERILSEKMESVMSFFSRSCGLFFN